MRNTFRFLLILFIPLKLFSQTDIYSGTWQMESYNPGDRHLFIELQIASPEKSTLYPARLKIKFENFTGDYELLLAKKNNWELGISKNKYHISEIPFSLGDWSMLLNGYFEYDKDHKELPTLTARRIQSKQYITPMPDTMFIDKNYRTNIHELRKLLNNTEIRLKKINNTPLSGETRDKILNPRVTPAYFGLLDTFHFQTRYSMINLSGTKKKDIDIVSVRLNGNTIIDQFELNKKKHKNVEIMLDTGLNILTMFAENFGNAQPNKGVLNLEYDDKKYSLDFTTKADSAATFIAVKLYCNPGKGNIFFQNNIFPGEEKKLLVNEKLSGSIIATSQYISLAIWDDAVEDGDSISININGTWLVQGFPVKKIPQFIQVILKPGPNIITFSGDNLGSIPPNTSVLEIIDGKKRKSFTMETSMGEKNLIRIFYDHKAGS